jgi:hypothetical protein
LITLRVEAVAQLTARDDFTLALMLGNARWSARFIAVCRPMLIESDVSCGVVTGPGWLYAAIILDAFLELDAADFKGCRDDGSK